MWKMKSTVSSSEYLEKKNKISGYQVKFILHFFSKFHFNYSTKWIVQLVFLEHCYSTKIFYKYFLLFLIYFFPSNRSECWLFIIITFLYNYFAIILAAHPSKSYCRPKLARSVIF